MSRISWFGVGKAGRNWDGRLWNGDGDGWLKMGMTNWGWGWQAGDGMAGLRWDDRLVMGWQVGYGMAIWGWDGRFPMGRQVGDGDGRLGVE